MFRYTSVLLGITLFAMALIWTASPGDAVQLPKKSEPVIWADTIHINLDEGPNAVKQDSAVKTNDNSFAVFPVSPRQHSLSGTSTWKTWTWTRSSKPESSA